MIASGKWTDGSINHYTVWTDVRLFVNLDKDSVSSGGPLICFFSVNKKTTYYYTEGGVEQDGDYDGSVSDS